MGKGGPLAFLNKKTWHPGRVQNLEEVWKRQQVAAQEEQKLKEYAKQLHEERGREELASVAEAAGHKIKADRLDWMYQGGLGQRQEADDRHAAQEAAVAANAAAADAPPVPVAASDNIPPGGPAPKPRLPAFYSEDTPASANEMWQRLHADPLFAIKQQELAARRNIVANPVKMQEIKQQVKELKQLAGKKEKKHKKDKKHKKEKKSKKEKRGRSSSPSSASEGERQPAAGAKRQRSASPPHGRPEQPPPSQPTHQQQQQQRDGPPHGEPSRRYDAPEQGRYNEPGRRYGAPEQGRYNEHSRRYDAPEQGRHGRRREDEQGRYGGRREDDRMREQGRRYDAPEEGRHGGRAPLREDEDRAQRPRSRSRDRGGERRARDDVHRAPRSRSRERGGERRVRGEERRQRSPERRRSRSRDRSQQQGGVQEARGDRQQQQQQQHEEGLAAVAADGKGRVAATKAEVGAVPESARAQVEVHMDAASAQAGVLQYGINWGSQVPEEARQADRSDFAEATRKRLTEAAARKEAEEREKAAQRYQKQEYRTGRLTEEEKQRKLAEMMGAAQEHEEDRAQRLRRQADKEAAEELEAVTRHHTDTASFLQAATKDVYGTTKGGSLEDTVGRRAYFSERRDGGGAAFRKH